MGIYEYVFFYSINARHSIPAMASSIVIGC